MPVNTPIYMDHHATTPVDPRVVEAMLPYFTEIFGNAASIDHLHGHAAQEAVEKSRGAIAQFIGARSAEEIVFTSGATESDNIALVGVAEAYGHKGNHIITSAVEHKAVLDTSSTWPERESSDRSASGPVWNGRPVRRWKAITDKTILVSIMMANNEIGTIQPVKEIGRIAKEHGVFFHTDAAQAVGHIPVDVEDMNIDLMSFTAHTRFMAPRVSELFTFAEGRPRVKLAPSHARRWTRKGGSLGHTQCARNCWFFECLVRDRRTKKWMNGREETPTVGQIGWNREFRRSHLWGSRGTGIQPSPACPKTSTYIFPGYREPSYCVCVEERDSRHFLNWIRLYNVPLSNRVTLLKLSASERIARVWLSLRYWSWAASIVTRTFSKRVIELRYIELWQTTYERFLTNAFTRI